MSDTQGYDAPQPDTPAYDASGDDFLNDPAPRRWSFGGWLRRRFSGGTLLRIALGLLILMLLYYPVGMIVMHKIDDDPAFDALDVPEGASHAVALAADLVEREVDVSGWRANDPIFLPSAALDNMPNFQQGIMAAMARFAVEMTDQIGRARGSSQADPDLEKAVGLLKYSGTIWIFDFATSWAPTASSEQQYREGVRRLRAYNERLAAGRASFEPRADNLLATLERIAADLGSASAEIDQRVLQGGGVLFDFTSDDVYYRAKGKLYGYALLIRALKRDFADVIAERSLGTVWAEMEESLFAAAELQPWMVVNGSPESQLLPSHLASQGFFLLRARVQMREIANILLK
ncbi:MAG: DUF2333 family protein [Dongiaceae bacterium]